ncbi:MAG: carbohydrate-binding domain-containing protein, partial [Muribaculaceae bacterium]
SGGEFTISVSGGGEWDADALKTKASACLGADGNITVDGGTFALTATGGGGKGFNADCNFTLNDGDVTITTSGGVVVYSNGTLSQNYTGSLDRIDSDYKSSPKGIKADGAVEINGGRISVVSARSEGIESKATVTINGGDVFVRSYDDCINSSSHLTINGGTVTVVGTNNDGLDANGHIYINGGTVMAFGGKSPECGLDANSEQGYTVFFTGGTLLAVGGGNSVPTTSASTQAFVTTSLSVTANAVVTIKSGTTELATFTVPAEYGSTLSAMAGPGGPGGGGPGGSSSGGMVITCPELVSGSSYTITSGTSTATATAKLK